MFFGFVIIRFHQAEIGAIFYHRQTLPDRIVKFARDAAAFGFVRVDQTARKFFLRVLRLFKSGNAYPVNYPRQQANRRRADDDKNPRSIKRRFDRNFKRRAGFVPDIIAVGGDDLKRVFARFDMRIKRRPARSGFRPVFFQTFQFVAKTHLFRSDETQSRVIYFEIFLTGKDVDFIFFRRGDLIVHADGFNDDGRRQFIDFDGFGADDCHTVLRRKPEFAVTHFRPGGLRAAVRFGRRHSVGFVVSGRNYRINFPVGKIVQKVTAGAVNSLIARHPEIAAFIFQNLKNAVAEKSVLLSDNAEFAVFKPHQTAVVSADPERSGIVLIERTDIISGDTGLLVKCGNSPVL